MEIDANELATVVGGAPPGSGPQRVCTPFETSRIEQIAKATGRKWGENGMVLGGVGGSFVSPGWGTAAGIVIGGVGADLLGQEVGALRTRRELGCVER